jgi:hypothetical protein
MKMVYEEPLEKQRTRCTDQVREDTQKRIWKVWILEYFYGRRKKTGGKICHRMAHLDENVN